MYKPMKHLHKILSVLLLWGVSLCEISMHGRLKLPGQIQLSASVFFRVKTLFIPRGNEAELERLYVLIDCHKAEIAAGRMPVHVDGYCASQPTAKENLNTAFIRANRVKSELITRKGLKETDFVTANYARAYHNNKDMVVVTLRIPSAKATTETTPAKEEVEREEPRQKEVTVEPETKPRDRNRQP